MLLLLLSGCEQQNNAIIDTVGQPPQLVQVSLTPSSINTDSINVGPTPKPDDVLSVAVVITVHANSFPEDPLKYIRYVVNSPDGQETLSEGFLLDDGVGADQLKGDGIYSAKASFQIQRVAVGLFQIAVMAEAINASSSNTLFTPFLVFRGNSAPVLSNLQAPDTIQSTGQSLVLKVKATDANGQGDIIRVIFNSYLPSGAPSSGNPFQMFDDGLATHGDSIAGDGIYGYMIQLPTISPGTYRFEFQAFDRFDAGSNVIVHEITVK